MVRGRIIGKILSDITQTSLKSVPLVTSSLNDSFISFVTDIKSEEKAVEVISHHLGKEPSKILRIEQDSLIIYNMSPALQEVINDIVEMYKILE